MFTNQNLFLRNVMMMIICSLVKIITTHTHTHTHEYINKIYSVISCLLRTFATFCYNHIQETTSILPRDACIISHTHTHAHTHTHTLTISNTNFTHTYIYAHKKKSYKSQRKHSPSISQISFSQPDDCRNKAAWKPGSQINIHAIK